MKKTMIVMAGLCFILVTGFAFAAGYEDTIPPEILRRYEPSIVKGERPILVRITQAMIFGLRDKPDQGGDVYSFDLDPAKVSSVQKDIIRKWVRDGHKILFWGHSDAAKYHVLFSDEISYSQKNGIDIKEHALSKHPVNIDVRSIKFSGLCNYNHRPNTPYYSYRLSRYPPDIEIIVSDEKGAIAGRIPYSRGSIYFALLGDGWSRGTDRDRWTLNFRQWMLGHRVPGTADTTLSAGNNGSKPTDAQPQDRILLKNGDTISGRILIEKFTVKTSYADLSFDLTQVETVVLEGAGQNIELLVLRTGDKLSGVIGPDKIKVKLTSGQEVEIEKDKIKEIVFQR